MVSNKEFSVELDKAIKVAQRIAPELLKLPHIVSVGPGVKRRKGIPTGQAAIVITVREKFSLEQLEELGEQPLPDQLEGVPVDVIEYQKPVETKKITQEIENAKKVIETISKDWLKENNITGIGIGYKEKGGQIIDIIAIQ